MDLIQAQVGRRRADSRPVARLACERGRLLVGARSRTSLAGARALTHSVSAWRERVGWKAACNIRQACAIAHASRPEEHECYNGIATADKLLPVSAWWACARGTRAPRLPAGRPADQSRRAAAGCRRRPSQPPLLRRQAKQVDIDRETTTTTKGTLAMQAPPTPASAFMRA